MRARRAPPARLAAVALALALAPAVDGCRYHDRKYWTLPVTTAIQRAAWGHESPGWNLLLRVVACVVIDLPLLPFTFGHDVYAFFALEDEGALPDDVPHPGEEASPPPPPPSVAITAVDDGRPVQDPAWSRGAFVIERTE